MTKKEQIKKDLGRSPYMSQIIESPVGLVVSRSGDQANAMTVSFFSEVSHHPTSMWISIAKDSYTHELLEQNGEFTFVSLHHRQASLAIECGLVSGRERNKADLLDLYESGNGFLFIRDALASTACRIFRSIDLGDHTLYLAEILSGDMHPKKAILRNLLMSDLQLL
jgi:flavin reductase (DIM6/NTAB) family NADH-FMN oxidoreductase RutF